jgi:transposase-like protein
LIRYRCEGCGNTITEEAAIPRKRGSLATVKVLPAVVVCARRTCGETEMIREEFERPRREVGRL